MEDQTHNKIIKYLLEERKVTPIVAERLAAEVSTYDDIKTLFLTWLRTRTYDDKTKVGGYTAAEIAALNPDFSGIGVYNFLTTLRDDPEFAAKAIKNNFERYD